MKDKRFITLARIDKWALEVAQNLMPAIQAANTCGRAFMVYPVPRGGFVPCYNLLAVLRSFDVRVNIGTLSEADAIIDDIIDSGETMRRCFSRLGKVIPFFAVVNKLETPDDYWYVFPWEDNGGESETVEDNVRRIMQFIGEDVEREGLKETPRRVVKAYQEWFSGYKVDPASVLKVFTDGADGVDEMVLVKDIKFYSHCEHHMAPFFGTVTIGYIPNGKIVGLSKFHRLVEVFARRMQVQERLTQQIAELLNNELTPKGVAVLVKARHLCVESRGARHVNSETVTNSLHGVFKTSADARNEFLNLAK